MSLVDQLTEAAGTLRDALVRLKELLPMGQRSADVHTELLQLGIGIADVEGLKNAIARHDTSRAAVMDVTGDTDVTTAGAARSPQRREKRKREAVHEAESPPDPPPGDLWYREGQFK